MSGFSSVSLYSCHCKSFEGNFGRWRLTRTSSDLESENGGLGHGVILEEWLLTIELDVYVKLLQGSAPFITYCSFFELLKLPKKLMMTGKSEKRMRCRSCLAIIQFELGSKELGASVPTQVKQLSAEFAPGTSDLPNENLQNVTGCLVNNDMIQWSDDYDNSSYHFNDSKLASPSKS
ncbi:hypothetical protein FXO37_02021 [Capsicum annuum]|nr:hypothetical protein FXO37_02021 [Capsicum annuum]